MSEKYIPLSELKAKSPSGQLKKTKPKEPDFDESLGRFIILVITLPFIAVSLSNIEGFFTLWIQHGFMQAFALFVRMTLLITLPTFVFVYIVYKCKSGFLALIATIFLILPCLFGAEFFNLWFEDNFDPIVSWWFGYN